MSSLRNWSNSSTALFSRYHQVLREKAALGCIAAALPLSLKCTRTGRFQSIVTISFYFLWRYWFFAIFGIHVFRSSNLVLLCGSYEE